MRTQIRIRPFQCPQIDQQVQISIETAWLSVLGEDTPLKSTALMCQERDKCPHAGTTCPLLDH